MSDNDRNEGRSPKTRAEVMRDRDPLLDTSLPELFDAERPKHASADAAWAAVAGRAIGAYAVAQAERDRLREALINIGDNFGGDPVWLARVVLERWHFAEYDSAPEWFREAAALAATEKATSPQCPYSQEILDKLTAYLTDEYLGLEGGCHGLGIEFDEGYRDWLPITVCQKCGAWVRDEDFVEIEGEGPMCNYCAENRNGEAAAIAATEEAPDAT